jgi:hypothetical protein
MKKTEDRTPEEIAKDLENIDFAEIGESDLIEVFGGAVLPGTSIDPDTRDSNGNCCC